MSEGKDAAAVRFFPPGIPLLTILFGIGLEFLFPLRLGLADPGMVRYGAGGAIIVGSILVFGLWAIITMRRSGQSENPYKPTFTILQEGPFKLTRNPMYLQMVLVCFGFAVMMWNAWLLLLTPVCAVLLTYLVIIPEEQYLTSKFGDAYREYRRTVRRWI